MIVAEIIFQRPLQMFGIQDHEVVQALPANGADQAFGVWILPRTARGSEELLSCQARRSSDERRCRRCCPDPTADSERHPGPRRPPPPAGRSRLPWDAR